MTNMTNGPYIPINQQSAGQNPYEDWCKNLIGIGHGKNWCTKFSSSWPIEFDSISALVINTLTTVSLKNQIYQDYNAEDAAVAKDCGFWNVILEESVDGTADKEKNRKLIHLLRNKPSHNPGPTATDFSLLSLLKN